MISKDDPRHEAATRALDAMHAFWELHPRSAVQWIEDSEGRVVIFTRGEYRDRMLQSIQDNIQPSEKFERLYLYDVEENAQ